MNLQAKHIWRTARRCKVSVDTSVILTSALAKGIPCRLTSGRWEAAIGGEEDRVYIKGSRTSKTLRQAMKLCGNKAITLSVLSEQGMPVPKHFLVKSVAEALDAMDRISFPVVVKPYNGTGGRDVSVGITSKSELTDIVSRALRKRRAVLVEEFLPGLDHRLLIVGGEMVAAVLRTPAGIRGDGVHSIRALIKASNSDPRRGRGHSNTFSRIRVNHDTLRTLSKQNLTLDSIPENDVNVVLRSAANSCLGGIYEDITELVHPDNQRLAAEAATLLQAGIAGVDFICPNIKRSYKEVGGGICEVNSIPDLRFHLSQPAGAAIVNYLLPDASLAADHRKLCLTCAPRPYPSGAIYSRKSTQNKAER